MISFLDTLSKIIIIVYGCYIFGLLKTFLPIRKNLLIKIIAFICCLQISAVYIFPNDSTNVYGLFLAFILYMLVFHRGTIIEKISGVMIIYPIIITINYITEDIGYLIYINNKSMSLLEQTILHLATVVIRIPVWMIIYYFFRDWISKATKNITFKMWLILDIICLASFIGIITLINFTPENTYITYPACIACLTTSLGCVYLTGYISKTLKTQMEIQNLKYQQSYYEELDENQQNVRKLRHDMNNHLNVIGSLLKNNKLDEANEYFKSLSDEFSVTNRIFCKNSIVNAVLNSKYNLAAQNQIDCQFQIDIGNMLELDDISLCSLFANTLDNAIEANLQIEKLSLRKILAKARFTGNCFSYQISNPKKHEIIERKDMFLTTKKDGSAHGFGLQNVRNIVSTYDGSIDIAYDDNSFTLTVLIPLIQSKA